MIIRLKQFMFFSLVGTILFLNTYLVFNFYVTNFPPDKNLILKTNKQFLGGDFIAFYTGGKLAKTDLPNLYDLNFQKSYRLSLDKYSLKSRESVENELPFVYPPLVACFFSWFTIFEYDKAFYAWTAFSILLSLSSLLFLSHYLSILTIKSSFFIFFSVAGFIPYSLNCLAGGQVATIGIAIYSIVFILLKKEKDFWAGFFLSLGYYKPPLFLFFSIVILLTRGKKFFWGCLFGAVIFTSLSVLYVGFPNFEKYLSLASHYVYGRDLPDSVNLNPELGMGVFSLLATFSQTIWQSIIFYLIFFIILLLISLSLFESFKSDRNFFDLFYSFVAVSSLSLSFQLIHYDLSILLPIFLIAFANRSSLFAYRFITFLFIFLFYIEWAFRKLEFNNLVFNLSSLLFIFLLFFLFSSIFYSYKVKVFKK